MMLKYQVLSFIFSTTVDTKVVARLFKTNVKDLTLTISVNYLR